VSRRGGDFGDVKSRFIHDDGGARGRIKRFLWSKDGEINGKKRKTNGEKHKNGMFLCLQTENYFL
jgi:hypothetical protein